MTNKQNHYSQLFKVSKHIRTLEGISQLLNWDQETYMPEAASGIRSEQIELLAGLIHKERTSPLFTTLLGRLIDIETGHILVEDLSPAQEAAVKLWRRDYRKTVLLPTAFVEEFAKVSSQSMQAWQLAKKENSFQIFAPFLDKIIHLNQQKAHYLGYSAHPYDALLDEYEPGTTTEEVGLLFEKIRTDLAPFIKKIASKKVDNHFLMGKWEKEKQILFGRRILADMGYDFKKGRVDFSSHPFSSSCHPSDSRITTRIHPESLMSNIFILLHEGGHSLYEMNLPPEEYGSPLGEPLSYGMHESQSRWWETRIGMSRPFWNHYYPLLQETFPQQLKSISLDSFYSAINKVEPSYIRVEADELTYPMHVILRFEMEKELIAGNLTTREVPEIWNKKMEQYLGLTPLTNTEGCLQDVHWSMGAFGYFPSYTLGNLYAAHLFEGFVKENKDWEKRVTAGELIFIKDWLHKKVHQHGRRYSAQELLKNATQEEFSAEPYLKYLKEKYSSLFQQ